MYSSFTSLVKFIPRYFILCVAFANGIIFLISFSASSLLVYRSATDFCILILYPATYYICLLFLIVFLVKSLGFSTYKIMSSANSDSLTSSFPIWCLIYFSCLIALARTSQVLIKKGQRDPVLLLQAEQAGSEPDQTTPTVAHCCHTVSLLEAVLA